MSALVLGVDPGKTGAVALLVDGRLVGAADMPVAGKIVSGHLLYQTVRGLLRHPLAPVVPAAYAAVIEDVHAMPSQGVTSMFSFGRSLGVVEGVLAGNGWPVHYVAPTRWKKALGLSRSEEHTSELQSH